jgi:hypothetical protein
MVDGGIPRNVASRKATHACRVSHEQAQNQAGVSQLETDSSMGHRAEHVRTSYQSNLYWGSAMATGGYGSGGPDTLIKEPPLEHWRVGRPVLLERFSISANAIKKLMTAVVCSMLGYTPDDEEFPTWTSDIGRLTPSSTRKHYLRFVLGTSELLLCRLISMEETFPTHWIFQHPRSPIVLCADGWIEFKSLVKERGDAARVDLEKRIRASELTGPLANVVLTLVGKISGLQDAVLSTARDATRAATAVLSASHATSQAPLRISTTSGAGDRDSTTSTSPPDLQLQVTATAPAAPLTKENEDVVKGKDGQSDRTYYKPLVPELKPVGSFPSWVGFLTYFTTPIIMQYSLERMEMRAEGDGVWRRSAQPKYRTAMSKYHTVADYINYVATQTGVSDLSAAKALDDDFQQSRAAANEGGEKPPTWNKFKASTISAAMRDPERKFTAHAESRRKTHHPHPRAVNTTPL